MSAAPESAPIDRRELTARVAYLLYEHRGRAPGRAREDWLLAERLIDLCVALLSALAPPSEPAPRASDSPPRPETSREDRAHDVLALLEAAVAADGRAAVARRLGYASPSSVGKILRGQRALTDVLVQRIVAALAPAARKAA